MHSGIKKPLGKGSFATDGMTAHPPHTAYRHRCNRPIPALRNPVSPAVMPSRPRAEAGRLYAKAYLASMPPWHDAVTHRRRLQQRDIHCRRHGAISVLPPFPLPVSDIPRWQDYASLSALPPPFSHSSRSAVYATAFTNSRPSGCTFRSPIPIMAAFSSSADPACRNGRPHQNYRRNR